MSRGVSEQAQAKRRRAASSANSPWGETDHEVGLSGGGPFLPRHGYAPVDNCPFRLYSTAYTFGST